jgi:lantibiotic modifying enzyme
MPRKIELKEFIKENGEFGCSVDIYCRDNKRLIKSKIFSASEDKGHFLLRSYEQKADFLTTTLDSNYNKIEVEHDKLIAKTILYKQAIEYLKQCERNYFIFD